MTGPAQIAALYVDPRGCYANLPGVDVWDEARDARLYAGPWPVVAHPPCARWCRLAGLVEHRYGLKRGEDGGCFASALEAVRAWGGVLEHPAYSDAWAAFDLPKPNPGGGWQRGFCGGWSLHVEQGHYGHLARKATWLYAFECDLPLMTAGKSRATAWVSWLDYRHGTTGRLVKRMSKRDGSATPPEFRDILIAMARSAYRVRKGAA